MRVDLELTDDGIAVGLEAFGAAVREARVRWPPGVWAAFASKRQLATELVYLLTSRLALGPPGTTLRYGFARPRFLEHYDRWLLGMRTTIDANPEGEPTALVLAERSFHGPASLAWQAPPSEPHRAVAALTMGKDSLASVLLARTLGLQVEAVLVQHPALSDDHLIRAPAMAAAGAELGLALHVMIDDVKALPHAAPSTHPSGILWSMDLACYALLMVPFAAAGRARYLLFGNEQELSHPMRTASGHMAVRSPLQSIAGMGELDRWLSHLTAGGQRLTSLVHALHRLAGHWLVHRARPALGTHQISCRQARADRRWCGTCRTCAENALFIAATGRDPTSIGLPLMLDLEHRQHYLVTTGAPDPTDPYHFRLAQQELLAFSLLAARGEDRAVQKLVRQLHGPDLEAARAPLERTYLQPVEPPTDLPLAAESFACARRLLASYPS